MKKQRPIMTLEETEKEYIAKVNGLCVNVRKDEVEVKNGIRQHPRMTAIEKVAELANISDWILFNV